MFVWIVEWYDWEGSSIIAVYCSKKLAEIKLKKLQLKNPTDSFSVTRYKVKETV